MPRKPLDADTAIRAFATLQAMTQVRSVWLTKRVAAAFDDAPEGTAIFAVSIRGSLSADDLQAVRGEMSALGLAVSFTGEALAVE